jgi:hypothetical protein
VNEARGGCCGRQERCIFEKVYIVCPIPQCIKDIQMGEYGGKQMGVYSQKLSTTRYPKDN